MNSVWLHGHCRMQMHWIQEAPVYNLCLGEALVYNLRFRKALVHNLRLRKALVHNLRLQEALFHNLCLQEALVHNLRLQENPVYHALRQIAFIYKHPEATFTQILALKVLQNFLLGISARLGDRTTTIQNQTMYTYTM